MNGWGKHWRLMLAVLGAAVLLGGGLSYVINRNASQIDTVHDAAVKACENSLKPGGVRFILAQQIQQQIRQSATVDYSKFFPDVPPDQLKALIEQQNARSQAEVRQLLGVDCASQYR